MRERLIDSSATSSASNLERRRALSLAIRDASISASILDLRSASSLATIYASTLERASTASLAALSAANYASMRDLLRASSFSTR